MTQATADSQSLAAYVGTRSSEAFAELVRRYADLVYSTAHRMVGESNLAQDVTQATFIVLAKKAGRIDARTLPGWLVNTARLAANEALRTQRIRIKHETQGAVLRSELRVAEDEPPMAEALPLLDDALSKLNETDRAAVVMRFMQGLSFAEVGAAMGLSDEAARKRVSRAVDKLRSTFMKRGMVFSAGGVMVVLATQQARAAPAFTAISTGAAGSLPGSVLAQGVLSIMTWAKIKTVLLVAMLLLFFAGAGWGVNLIHRASAEPPATMPATQPVAQKVPPEVAILKLNPQYQLKDGEVLRVFDAPFSPEREAFVAALVNWPPGGDEARSVGFRYTSSGLGWAYISIRDQPLEQVLNLTLGEPWYRVEGLESIPWTPVHGDFVIRDGATVDEKFKALATLIHDREGVDVKFVAHKKTRPCIILHGRPKPAPENDQHFQIVTLTQTQMDPDEIVEWGNGDRPPGTKRVDFSEAAQALGAPIIPEPPEPTDKHGDSYRSYWYILGPDAHLNPDESNYTAKLQKVVDNLNAQVGGDWRIENREIEYFVVE